MVTYLNPSGDISNGGWTASNAASLWQATLSSAGPSPDDSSFALGDSADTTFEVHLDSAEDPNSSDTHLVKIRARSQGGGGGPERFDASLYQGADLIVQTHTNQSVDRISYTDYDVTLNTADADSITDYSDLRIRVTVNSLGGGETLEVSQIYMQIPEVEQGTEASTPSKNNPFYNRTF